MAYPGWVLDWFGSVWKPVHLYAMAAYFGCSCWVSFVAGLVMFKSLPRHTFGKLQSKLFPAYFRFTSGCLAVALMSLGAGSDIGQADKDRRGTSILLLGSALALQLLNMLWLEPVTTRIMFKRHIVEREFGTGHEIGQLTPDNPEARRSDELQRLTRKFGMWHGLSASANLVSILLAGWEMSQVCL